MLRILLFSPIVLIVLTGFLIVLYRHYRKRARLIRLIERIPGPPSLPLIGNTIEVNVEHDELFERMMGTTKLWGRRVGVNREWLGTKPYILVFHPDRLEPILGNTKFIEKSNEYVYLCPWLGTGLLTSSGSKWHLRRKILTPAFHFKILEDFIDVFIEQSIILADKLSQELKNADGFNIFPYITLCTLDIVCETAMGRQVNAQRNSESEYVKAVYEIGSIIQNRQKKIWLQPNFLFRLSSLFRKHQKCIKILHGFSKKVIRERKIELKKRKEQINKNKHMENPEDNSLIFGEKKRLAFLDLLIEASQDGHNLSDEDIREEVDTFMFEDKVVEEIESILGPDSERRFTMKDLQEMKYLECCIKEALRLYPSVPVIARHLTEDIEIVKNARDPKCNSIPLFTTNYLFISAHYTIPAGTTAIIVTYMLHRNPQIYPQPEKFNPDNFLPENVLGRHPYAYIPFSAGPRNCIGQKFAILEEKAVIASVLRRYRVEAVDRREDLTLLGELILRPKHGLKVKIFPRI
ncbi:Cytochrome P450 4c3 [Blattella germanica]|nr:Cytochrome P450 4c3 [Blattella germanica]